VTDRDHIAIGTDHDAHTPPGRLFDRITLDAAPAVLQTAFTVWLL
jgi:hypothetical protein